MYETVEARLNNNTVIFNEGFNAPQKDMKVLITFIEVKSNNVTPLFGSEEVL
jgi:phosphate starvation-inducible protein PhoH